MNSYIARVGKIVGAGLLGLMASPSATAMESPNYLQNNKLSQPSGVIEHSFSEDLESRLSTDLELSQRQPLEFIKGLKSTEYDEAYAAELVTQISSAETRFLALRQMDTYLNHSELLDETIRIAKNQSYQFIQRKNAIEHLGYLFERNGTKKNDEKLDSIALALHSIVGEDLQKTERGILEESSPANILTIQAINTAHRYLQKNPNKESSQLLIKRIYDLAEKSNIEHIDEHVAWVLDSVYMPKKSEDLNEAYVKKAEKFSLTFFQPEGETKDKKELKKLRKDYIQSISVGENSRELEKHLVEEPRWTYDSEDHLENYYLRFEKVFRNGTPELKLEGSKEYVSKAEKFFERLEENHPDCMFGLKLNAERITVGKRHSSSSEYASRTVHIGKIYLDDNLEERGWKGFKDDVRHEFGHLMQHDLGISLKGGSHIEEEQVMEWEKLSDPSFRRQATFEKSMEILLSLKHWR